MAYTDIYMEKYVDDAIDPFLIDIPVKRLISEQGYCSLVIKDEDFNLVDDLVINKRHTPNFDFSGYYLTRPKWWAIKKAKFIIRYFISVYPFYTEPPKVLSNDNLQMILEESSIYFWFDNFRNIQSGDFPEVMHRLAVRRKQRLESKIEIFVPSEQEWTIPDLDNI